MIPNAVHSAESRKIQGSSPSVGCTQGTYTDVYCVTYVGQSVTYTEQVLNDDGQDGPGDATCDDIVLDPPPTTSPYASLVLSPQPLTYGAAPCHSATATLTMTVTGLQVGSDQLRPSGYYTVQACAVGGSPCYRERWHVGAAVYAAVLAPPTALPSATPPSTPTPLPSATPSVKPVSIVGYSQLNGDISINEHGDLALYVPNDGQQVAQVPLNVEGRNFVRAKDDVFGPDRDGSRFVLPAAGIRQASSKFAGRHHTGKRGERGARVSSEFRWRHREHLAGVPRAPTRAARSRLR